MEYILYFKYESPPNAFWVKAEKLRLTLSEIKINYKSHQS